MNKKNILLFVAANIVAMNIYAQPCISTVKQLDSLIGQLKINVPVKQVDKQLYSKQDSLYNWQNNFPIQLCKKIPLFESKNIQEYSYNQRLVEYMALLNFYRHSNDSAIRNYIATKFYQVKYYEFFYNAPNLPKIEVPETLIKAMMDYTKKNIDTLVLKKIIMANQTAKNKKLDTLSIEEYQTDSAAYCKKLFNSNEMDYFILKMASDFKLIQFGAWLENNKTKEMYGGVEDTYWKGAVETALARMRYKNYYEQAMKEYINPPVYIDADQYAPNVLYIECKECFNEWLKQLSDTTTKIVIVSKSSEKTYYDTAYLAKYTSECLFVLFSPNANWSSITYKWFFYPSMLGMESMLLRDKSIRLPFNRDKLQKFIKEGYPFNVSRYYYKYINSISWQ